MPNALDAVATPPLILDRKREFGGVHPPEQIVCYDGKSVRTAYREERPHVYGAFMQTVPPDADIFYKTICYEQDGFSFDADGALIAETMDAKAHQRARKMAAMIQAELAAKAAHANAMAEAGFGNVPYLSARTAPPRPLTAADVAANPNDGAVDGTSAIANDFDVVGWAAGHVEAPWFVVVKAIREKYGLAVKDKKHAIEALVENRIIPASTILA